MAKSWYVLHTYSGYENKIERTIRIMMDEGQLGEVVTDIKVPAEQVVEVKDGKKRVTNKKFLPGYVLLFPNRPWSHAPYRRGEGFSECVSYQRATEGGPRDDGKTFRSGFLHTGPHSTGHSFWRHAGGGSHDASE